MLSIRTAQAVMVVVVGWMVGGCGGALVRVPGSDAGRRAAGPPRIDRALDLGGLPLPEVGALPTEHADKLFTPGEWVALVGENLTAQPQISIAGRPIPAAGFLAGSSLLVRVPRGLPPGMQTLTVDNGAGKATVELPTAHYVYGADTQGNSLRIRRLGPDGVGFSDKTFDLEFAKARFSALSPDGSLLYTVQEPQYEQAGVSAAGNAMLGAAQAMGDGGGSCELLVVHLGAKGGPKKLQTVALSLSSRPTGLAMSRQGLLVVLQARQLTMVDVTNPLQPNVVGALPLFGAEQPREIVDAEFLADGRRLAVLEAYGNQVLLIDLSNPAQPRPLPAVSLARELDQPFSIDLALAADGQSLWVLQGPNLRLAGQRLRDGLRSTFSDVKALEFKAAGKTLGGTAVGTAMLPREGLSRLVQLTLSETGPQLAKSITLPSEIFPFFALPAPDGSVYVSGISRSNPFENVQASLDGMLRLLQALKNTVQLGSVLKVGTEDGSISEVQQGMAIYYDLAVLPSGQLLTSTMRLGPGYLPPRLTLDWGFEIAGGPFTKLREVANTGFKITEALQRLLPPYRYERIGSQ